MLKFAIRLLIGLVVAFSAGWVLAAPDPFDAFQRSAHKVCPARQLQYLMQGDWTEIMVDGEGPSFGPATDDRVATAAQRISRALHCDQYAAIDCDVGAQFRAIQSLGLMRDTVRQVCSHWRCTNEADCTYDPSPKTGSRR